MSEQAVAVKECRGCSERKPLTEFHRHKASPDGLRPRCKACRRAEGIMARGKAAQRAHIAVSEKRCTACGAVKPIGEFAPRGSSPDGHRGACRACHNARQTERLQQPEALKRRRVSVRRYNRSEKGAANAQKHRRTEKRRAYTVAWMEAKRAEKAGVEGSFTREEFQALCNRYGNRCLRCGATGVRLAADHVVPLSLGGRGSIDNIQPLCMSCNSVKGNKATDYRADIGDVLRAAP